MATAGASDGATLTGAQLIAQTLKAAGVRWVFSLSGNQILSLYEALDREDIRLVHTRHEGAAVHMADAWARLTGGVGVCLVTAGAGHANALGALTMAGSGESPVLLLSGHAPLTHMGGETVAGAFQEMDQVGLARPATRWSDVARDVAQLPAVVAEALRRTRAGRPGPVHLSLPVNVLEGTFDENAPEVQAGEPAPTPTDSTVDQETSFREIVNHLHDAARPLILAGPSAARPTLHEKLRALSAHTHVPFVVVDHPRGLTDPALGHAASIVKRADAVLLFGARQDYRIAYGAALAPDCLLMQIDPDPKEIARHRPVAQSLVANLAPAADQLLTIAAGAERWPESAWSAEVHAALAAPHTPPERTTPASESHLHPWWVVDALAHLLDNHQTTSPDTCLVIDGGEFGQWARARLADRLRREAPRHLINEPSGTIGYAVPFAIAAKLARPNTTVVALMGDGAFGFYAMELETAARLGLGLVLIVGNDGKWGTEYHLQHARYGRAVAMDLLPARYDLMAQSLGGHGELVEREEDLRPALERALETAGAGRPAVINARIATVPSPAGAPP